MKNMIEGGADVDLPTLKGGETPLILATERGLYHCTKALLDAGANTQLVAKVHTYSGVYSFDSSISSSAPSHIENHR